MDNELKHFLDAQHEAWRRRKFGVAAIGCAVLLAACGGGEEEQQTDAHVQPVKCGERVEACK